MKRISTIALSFVFTALFAAAAFAQATPGKIGWIDTGAFADPKEGVTKYNTALTSLDNEMKPKVVELQNIQKQLQAISDDIKKMQANTAVPVKPEAIIAKQEEGQKLQLDFEYKKKAYDAAVESRSGQVLGPVSADISKAIQDFAKQKGYAVVLDIAALANANAILALDPTSNITKEFIAYYNTRPAATATAVTPK